MLLNSHLRAVLLLLPAWLLGYPAAAQEFQIPADLGDNPVLAELMPRLGRAAIEVERATPKPDLALLFRAQLVAGLYRDALRSLDSLRAPLLSDPSPRVRARFVQYLLYARAELISGETEAGFESAYRSAFHTMISPLDDRTAAAAIMALDSGNLNSLENTLKQDLERLKGQKTASLEQTQQLIRDFLQREVYRRGGPAAAPLIAEDDTHRYAIQRDIRVAVPGGAAVCALVIRPRRENPLPALLQFTIYNDPDILFRDARRTASNGYAGVIGLTRGKGCGSGEIVPYVHEGADAAELIDWIAAEPWSDGQVGMYGGSYSGFTPWAAAKLHPRALKAIMVGAPNAPGIDSPMEGNVFWNFIYPWPLYTTANKTLDEASYQDSARWQRLNRSWYSSGAAYRDLDKIDGTPNPIFDGWLKHPSYDAFWQSLIPFEIEFSTIDIPILETAGYYFGGPGAALYYLSQNYRYNPRAQHFLLIGPYDHFMAQRGTATAEADVEEVDGYKLDPVAHLDITELRFKWFDHVLKGAPQPEILADKINYEVTGANLWKHSASIEAMSAASRTYFLSPAMRDGSHSLSASRPAAGSIEQTIDFSDRRDVGISAPGGGVQDKDLDSTNGLVFISEPLTASTELSGLFSGTLEFFANKKDFDFQISLFELTASGEYMQLAPFWSRASYVGDLSQRRLLAPGKLQSLNFQSIRLMSRQLGAGSRIVAVLSIIKEPERQINYGTGKNVSAESIAEAGVPLRIRWLTSSHIDLPVGK